MEIEVAGFLIQVPLKERMKVEDFLEVADRLAAMDGRMRSAAPAAPPEPYAYAQPVPLQPVQMQPPTQPMEHVLNLAPLSHEDRIKVDHMMNHLRAQMEHVKSTEERLEKHERHIEQILSYLQSLDRYIRR